MKNTYIPVFIISEVHQNPERIQNIFLGSGVNPGLVFSNEVNAAAAAGIIHPIDSKQLIINIVGLCVFPIAARPIIKTILNQSDDEFLNFIEVRKKELANFIINAIKVH